MDAESSTKRNVSQDELGRILEFERKLVEEKLKREMAHKASTSTANSTSAYNSGTQGDLITNLERIRLEIEEKLRRELIASQASSQVPSGQVSAGDLYANLNAPIANQIQPCAKPAQPSSTSAYNSGTQGDLITNLERIRLEIEEKLRRELIASQASSQVPSGQVSAGDLYANLNAPIANQIQPCAKPAQPRLNEEETETLRRELIASKVSSQAASSTSAYNSGTQGDLITNLERIRLEIEEKLRRELIASQASSQVPSSTSAYNSGTQGDLITNLERIRLEIEEKLRRELIASQASSQVPSSTSAYNSGTQGDLITNLERIRLEIEEKLRRELIASQASSQVPSGQVSAGDLYPNLNAPIANQIQPCAKPAQSSSTSAYNSGTQGDLITYLERIRLEIEEKLRRELIASQAFSQVPSGQVSAGNLYPKNAPIANQNQPCAKPAQPRPRRNNLEVPRKLNDCYYYYYSSCTKEDSCGFRHEPSALGCETECKSWQQGKCKDMRCKLRHMELKKNRKLISCYWEDQPGGCTKEHCPFKHKMEAESSPPTLVSDNSIELEEPRPGSSKSKIKCVTCRNLFGPYIYQCRKRHASCQQCQNSSRGCGICGGEILSFRIVSLESKLGNIRMNCGYKGCCMNSTAADMALHEKSCLFRDMECPVRSTLIQCRWKGKLSELGSHFRNKHPENVSAVDQELVLKDITSYSLKPYFILMGRYNFLVFIGMFPKEQTTKIAIQLIGSDPSPWTYEVHLYRKADPIKKIIYTELCTSHTTNITEIFASNKCVVLPAAYLVTFATFGCIYYKIYIKS